MPIFKNQGLLTIELDTLYDLTSATSTKILYQKPDGTKGEWEAAVSDTTKVSVSLDDDSLDQAGTWIFQAYAVEDSRTAYGQKAYVTVEPNLD